ncbi:unnamed protein product [Closterium sp. Naga37s-1]|nr:unnamed protein product [Closterium sp. Naga37s-1]
MIQVERFHGGEMGKRGRRREGEMERGKRGRGGEGERVRGGEGEEGEKGRGPIATPPPPPPPPLPPVITHTLSPVVSLPFSLSSTLSDVPFLSSLNKTDRPTSHPPSPSPSFRFFPLSPPASPPSPTLPLHPNSCDGFPFPPLLLLTAHHTWERAKLAQTLDRVVVATDDERIASCCQGFGAEVVMTSAACGNGSERCAEAVERLKGQWDVVVNIQGDEPLIDPATIDAVVIALQEAPEAVAATAVADIKASAAPDPNRVKCVVDSRGFALYFSRALIPHNRDGVPHPGFPYMLHLGLQAYDAAFLARYKASEAGRLEEEEQLEQLRILEQGCKVKVVKVAHSAHGVDVPADVKRIEDLLLRGGR